MGSSDFLVNIPQCTGKEVFGSAKRHLYVEPGADDDSHRFDKINFSHPKALAKALKTKLYDFPLAFAEHDLEVDVFPLYVGNQTSNVVEPIRHVTVVHESDCDVQQWHIRRLPFVGRRLALQCRLGLGKKCTQKIFLSILAPTYFGIFHVRSKNQDFEQFFYFCPNDIARCVKGTRRKWVKSCPDVPHVWPVQRGTNLTAREIMTLEEVGFQF